MGSRAIYRPPGYGIFQLLDKLDPHNMCIKSIFCHKTDIFTYLPKRVLLESRDSFANLCSKGFNLLFQMITPCLKMSVCTHYHGTYYEIYLLPVPLPLALIPRPLLLSLLTSYFNLISIFCYFIYHLTPPATFNAPKSQKMHLNTA